MTDRSRSLTELCGGRFGVLPADVCENPRVSDGGFRLFAAMCAAADAEDVCKFFLANYARRLGVDRRTIQRRKVELEAKGLIEQLHRGDRPDGSYRVVRNPRDRFAAAARNLPKIAKRQAVKTRVATSASRDGDTDVAVITTHESNQKANENGLRSLGALISGALLGKGTKRRKRHQPDTNRRDRDDVS